MCERMSATYRSDGACWTKLAACSRQPTGLIGRVGLSMAELEAVCRQTTSLLGLAWGCMSATYRCYRPCRSDWASMHRQTCATGSISFQGLQVANTHRRKCCVNLKSCMQPLEHVQTAVVFNFILHIGAYACQRDFLRYLETQ